MKAHISVQIHFFQKSYRLRDNYKIHDREREVKYIIIYLLTYLLRGAQSFLRSWLVLQLVKKFPAFYGTRKFITGT